MAKIREGESVFFFFLGGGGGGGGRGQWGEKIREEKLSCFFEKYVTRFGYLITGAPVIRVINIRTKPMNTLKHQKVKAVNSKFSAILTIDSSPLNDTSTTEILQGLVRVCSVF